MRWAKRVGAGLLWLVILLCLAITIVPHFLDRIYYRGPVSGHYDGQRFFNPDGEDDVMAPPGRGGRSGFIARYLTGSDGRPDWPDRVLLTPARPPARVAGERMLVTWIGHASVLVQTQGLNILTDPVWSNTVGPFGIGPARVSEPGVRFEDLPKIDLVLVSHDHYDHLDLATLRRLWQRDRPRIVTSLGNDSVIRASGATATAVDWGQAVPVRPGVSVVVTRAHHWGSRWFADRNRALWSGFVVRLPRGGNLFFGGDTGAGDMRWPGEAASYGPIRLALIPIGAFRFAPGQMAAGSHIGPVDAVEVYRRLGASHAIGIHWGTFRESFEAYDTPPRLLHAAMVCTGQHGFGTIPLGRTVAIPPARPTAPVPEVPRAELMRCLGQAGALALR